VRVFLAGATGVIGVRLVALLVAAGHEVAGMSRSPGRSQMLTELGAEPIVCDVFDAQRLRSAVVGFGPDVVLHHVTDLPDDPALVRTLGPANSRVRREGTRNLLAAAGEIRVVAQSVAWTLAGDAGEAVREHESAVLAAGGVVVRYGQFYGPGTYFPSSLPDGPRIHVDDAARRTLPLLSAPSGVVVLVD
jgi:nucleoside-diphosphate-sugar epimerase